MDCKRFTFGLLVCFAMNSIAFWWSSFPSTPAPYRNTTFNVTAEEAEEVGSFRQRLVGGPFRQRLPQAICIGSKKSGTTALTTFLMKNPRIKAPPDEVHFFDAVYFHEADYGRYRKRMPMTKPNEITIEKTPKYFVYPPAAARIHAMNNSMKLLLILRDPVKRLLSDYKHEKNLPDLWRYFPDTKKRNRRVEKDYSLEELVFSVDGGLNMSYEPVVASMYDVHVQRFLALFPREQLLVVDSEKFIKDPVSILHQCEDFLGVPRAIHKGMFKHNKNNTYNCSDKRCVGNLYGDTPHEKQTLRKLRDLYAPYVRNLVGILGQTFEWQFAYM